MFPLNLIAYPLAMSSSSADHVVQDDDSALQQLKATLNKLYRLTIQDGRSFTGTLVCLDKELNVILSGTTEVNSEGEERDVGMVRPRRLEML